MCPLAALVSLLVHTCVWLALNLFVATDSPPSARRDGRAADASTFVTVARINMRLIKSFKLLPSYVCSFGYISYPIVECLLPWGCDRFDTNLRDLQPVHPPAHVTGRLRVPLVAPNAHPLVPLGTAHMHVEQGRSVERALHGGYARAPVDMAFVPVPRTPVANHRGGAGVGYHGASAYGAGLVSLPSEYTTYPLSSAN